MFGNFKTRVLLPGSVIFCCLVAGLLIHFGVYQVAQKQPETLGAGGLKINNCFLAVRYLGKNAAGEELWQVLEDTCKN